MKVGKVRKVGKVGKVEKAANSCWQVRLVSISHDQKICSLYDIKPFS